MKIGFIGSGNIGSIVARKAIEAGHTVILSNSRGPESLSDLIEQLGPKASAATAQDAAEQGEVVVVTIPLKHLEHVPAAPLAGKVIIDTMNYYPERDGQIAALDSGDTTTSEMTAAHLPQSKVVKAFNSIHAAEIGSAARPKGDPARRALPIVGDDASAKAVVAGLIEAFGFDVVDAGGLHEGFRFENGTPAYGARAGRVELEGLLAKA
jgi:predicted dinucleotide-binding enzyme